MALTPGEAAKILSRLMLGHLCQGKAADPTADEKPGSRKQLRSLDRPHPRCAHSSASPWGPRWRACFLSRRQTHRLLPSSGKRSCNRVTGRGAGHCPPLTPSYEPPSSDLTSQSFRLPSRCRTSPGLGELPGRIRTAVSFNNAKQWINYTPRLFSWSSWGRLHVWSQQTTTGARRW